MTYYEALNAGVDESQEYNKLYIYGLLPSVTWAYDIQIQFKSVSSLDMVMSLSWPKSDFLLH